MLAKMGCNYVVIGHSERRQDHAESDETVKAKVTAAYRNSLVPILCVGEPLEVRREGGQVAHATAQLRAATVGLAADSARTLVVAYEPIWAIGTGEVATPGDAQEVCAALRETLVDLYPEAEDARILYGGSVKPDNVAAIMAEKDVDGALVGGASLSVDDFAAIVRFRDPASAPAS
jgi:triosephosphate isomerase (TIM)